MQGIGKEKFGIGVGEFRGKGKLRIEVKGGVGDNGERIKGIIDLIRE
jgi:hypothetical protein